MALTDKLSAIGDAIRAKTGETGLLRLDEMPTAIAGIQTGGGGDDDLVAYFKDELVEYRVPDEVTTLPENAFAERDNLVKVDLNKVTTLKSNSFYSCNGLVDVDFSKVEYIYGANHLQGTKITYIDLSSIKNLGTTANNYDRTFSNSANLEEVRNFKPTHLHSYIFFSCPKLTTIDLSELKQIGSSALYGCDRLGDLILPKIEVINQDAFKCSSNGFNRTIIDIGANCTSIGANAFANNKNVQTIIVRATTPPSLANVNAFNSIIPSSTSGDHGKYIYVPRDSLQAYMNATNWTAFVGSGQTYRAIEDYPEITGG